MAERITKVVQGVDNLFDEIVVNGRTVKSTPSAHVALTSQNPPAQASEPVQGEDVEAVQLNDIIHNLKDKELTEAVGNIASLIPSDATSTNKLVTKGYVDLADNGMKNRLDTLEGLVPSTASSSNKLTDKNYVDSADSAMQSDISDIGGEITALQNLVGAIQSRLAELNAMIPNQASAQNQLADKDFVNSSISTNTANFLGTYSTLAEIEAIQNPTNNDYAFLETTDASGNTVFDRYKYSGADNQWLFEYELNNSSFTAEQWATINSGLTSNSISNAINALDVASVGGNNKYIKAISETDGKIFATEGDVDTSVTQNSSNPVTGGAVWTALQGITPPAVVDSVTVGNMNPVTSNAVALELANMQTRFIPDYDNLVSLDSVENIYYFANFSLQADTDRANGWHIYKDAVSQLMTEKGYYDYYKDIYFEVPFDCVIVSTDITYTENSQKYSRAVVMLLNEAQTVPNQLTVPQFVKKGEKVLFFFYYAQYSSGGYSYSVARSANFQNYRNSVYLAPLIANTN